MIRQLPQWSRPMLGRITSTHGIPAAPSAAPQWSRPDEPTGEGPDDREGDHAVLVAGVAAMEPAYDRTVTARRKSGW
jgi:hypothetical protein